MSSQALLRLSCLLLMTLLVAPGSPPLAGPSATPVEEDPCEDRCLDCLTTCSASTDSFMSGSWPAGVYLFVMPHTAWSGCSKDISSGQYAACVTCCPCQQAIVYSFASSGDWFLTSRIGGSGDWTNHYSTVYNARARLSAACGDEDLLEFSVETPQGTQTWYQQFLFECAPCVY